MKKRKNGKKIGKRKKAGKKRKNGKKKRNGNPFHTPIYFILTFQHAFSKLFNNVKF